MRILKQFVNLLGFVPLTSPGACVLILNFDIVARVATIEKQQREAHVAHHTQAQKLGASRDSATKAYISRGASNHRRKTAVVGEQGTTDCAKRNCLWLQLHSFVHDAENRVLMCCWLS